MVHERKFNVKPTPSSSKLIICLILTLIIALTTMTCSPARLNQPVSAWVDQNNNAKRDAGEPPLEGVQFNAYDTKNRDATLEDSAITDWDGKAILSFDKPANTSIKISIDAIPPEGYRSLVTGLKSIKNFGDVKNPPIDFGFTQLAGFLSPTPKTPGLDCAIYPLKDEDIGVENLAYNSNLGLWAINLDGGVIVFSGSKYPLRTFPPLQEYSGSDTSVDIHPNGSIFLRADSYIAQYKNDQWKVYKFSNIMHSMFTTLSTTADGNYWFNLNQFDSMLVSFNPYKHTWRFYGPASIADSKFQVFIFESSGAYYAQYKDLSPLPEEELVLPDGWSMIDQHVFSPNELEPLPIEGWIEHAKRAPDGTIWFTQGLGVSSFNPSSHTLINFSPPTSALGEPFSIEDIAPDPDGSVWMIAIDEHPYLFHLQFSDNSLASPHWTIYDPRDGFRDDISLHKIVTDDSGGIWLGYEWVNEIARCTPIVR
jgi:hypothetical protein